MQPDTYIERDAKTGRFLAGNSGFGGRPKGSRNKLGEAFVADLRDAWEEHGRDVIARVARDEPAALLKVIASLLPKDLNINQSVEVNAASFLDNFRQAVAMLGNEPRKALPKVRVFNGGGSRAAEGHRRRGRLAEAEQRPTGGDHFRADQVCEPRRGDRL